MATGGRPSIGQGLIPIQELGHTLVSNTQYRDLLLCHLPAIRSCIKMSTLKAYLQKYGVTDDPSLRLIEDAGAEFQQVESLIRHVIQGDMDRFKGFLVSLSEDSQSHIIRQMGIDLQGGSIESFFSERLNEGIGNSHQPPCAPVQTAPPGRPASVEIHAVADFMNKECVTKLMNSAEVRAQLLPHIEITPMFLTLQKDFLNDHNKKFIENEQLDHEKRVEKLLNIITRENLFAYKIFKKALADTKQRALVLFLGEEEQKLRPT